MTLKKTPMDDTYQIPQKTIVLDLWKAVAILLTAMLGSAGAGLWSGIATLNADHYQLTALAQTVHEHEQSTAQVTTDLQAWVRSVDMRLANIEGRLGVK